MKKQLLIMAAASLLLGGCGNVKEEARSFLENEVTEKSGIKEDEDYVTYESLATEGKLDDNGFYIDESLDEETDEISDDNYVETNGNIHVTFADNRYLDIKYYLDENYTSVIDVNNFYLNPGDVIYASNAENLNPYSDDYHLYRFDIYSYGEDNSREKIDVTDATQKYVYQIPDTFTETQIQIIPIGAYPDGDIMTYTYYEDDIANKISLSNAGTWYVDNEEMTDTKEIKPNESFIMSYKYDADNYFYVSSQPKCYNEEISTEDEKNIGKVEFWEDKLSDNPMTYEVELHPYLELKIKFDKKATVTLNDGEAQTVKKKKTWTSNKLKYGDKIVIETKGSCEILDGDYSHITASRDPLTDDNIRYTITIGKEAATNIDNKLVDGISVIKDITLIFDTTDPYGKCTFKSGKENLSGEVTLKEGSEVKITYKITDSGYTFAEGRSGITGKIKDVFSSDERSDTITITEDMYGKVISRKDFFEVIKKE